MYIVDTGEGREKIIRNNYKKKNPGSFLLRFSMLTSPPPPHAQSFGRWVLTKKENHREGE
jgi:hypothetical protein